MGLIIGANLSERYPFESAAKTLSEIGFKWCQVWLDILVSETKNYSEGITERKAALEEYNLNVICIHTNMGSEEHLRKLIECSNILGCKDIIFHPLSEDELLNSIPQIKKLNGETRISIENAGEHNYKMTEKEISMIFSNGLFLAFDICHALQCGINIDSFWARFKNKISIIHLSDFDGANRHIITGEGYLRKTSFFTNIKNIDKPVILEHKSIDIDDFKRVYSKALSKFY